MEKGLLEKTGKPLKHWIKIVRATKIEKHKAIISYLQEEHDFTYGFANFVSLKARNSDAGSMDSETLLTLQYKGKELLFPIYEELIRTIQKFGSDISINPKKSAVSLVRKKQFVLIKPATKSRIDLGLKLKGIEPSGRLEHSGPFGSMCTHRVRISSIDQIDSELINWMHTAYEKAV